MINVNTVDMIEYFSFKKVECDFGTIYLLIRVYWVEFESSIANY